VSTTETDFPSLRSASSTSMTTPQAKKSHKINFMGQTLDYFQGVPPLGDKFPFHFACTAAVLKLSLVSLNNYYTLQFTLGDSQQNTQECLASPDLFAYLIGTPRDSISDYTHTAEGFEHIQKQVDIVYRHYLGKAGTFEIWVANGESFPTLLRMNTNTS